MSLLHWIGLRRPCFLAGVVSLVMLLAAGSQAKVPRAGLKGADNTVVRSYIWGLDVAGDVNCTGGVGGLVAVKHATGGTHFAITDGSGNVAGLINAADGTQSAPYEYDPFGQTLRKSGMAADLNPLRFSSRYTDSETGTLHYGFRYYAPATGRWLNRDPIGEWGGLNLYGFANNDEDGSVVRIEVQSKIDVPAVLRSRNASLDQQLSIQGFTPTPPIVIRPR